MLVRAMLYAREKSEKDKYGNSITVRDNGKGAILEVTPVSIERKTELSLPFDRKQLFARVRFVKGMSDIIDVTITKGLHQGDYTAQLLNQDELYSSFLLKEIDR